MDHGTVSPKKSRRVCLVLWAATLASCTTSSRTLIGQTRTPLSSGEVRIFLEPVSGPYERIAIVAASSRQSLSWTAESKAEVVMQRLKSEAAKLGANGILLEEITYGTGGSVGGAVGPDLTRDHASLGVGFSATGLLGSRYGRGVAIYIPSAATVLPAHQGTSTPGCPSRH